jgi:hypothetical protein
MKLHLLALICTFIVVINAFPAHPSPCFLLQAGLSHLITEGYLNHVFNTIIKAFTQTYSGELLISQSKIHGI